MSVVARIYSNLSFILTGILDFHPLSIEITIEEIIYT